LVTRTKEEYSLLEYREDFELLFRFTISLEDDVCFESSLSLGRNSQNTAALAELVGSKLRKYSIRY